MKTNPKEERLAPRMAFRDLKASPRIEIQRNASAAFLTKNLTEETQNMKVLLKEMSEVFEGKKSA